MLRTRTRALLAAGALMVATSAVGTATASAHAGSSNCTGNLVRVQATHQGTCDFPFQGYPVGMAAVYRPSTVDPNIRYGEIHAEVLLKPAFGTPQKLSMECYDPEPVENENGELVIPKEPGEHRCFKEYQTPQAGTAFSLVKPIPTEIVSMRCSAHSHSFSSVYYPPSGSFACWSTDEAREHLENDLVFEEMGF